jgi:hypothetical protein
MTEKGMGFLGSHLQHFEVDIGNIPKCSWALSLKHLKLIGICDS